MSEQDDGEVHQGERYAKSPLSGWYYRVTRWKRVDEEKIHALDKEQVMREEVPDEWLEVLDDAS